ncbi:tetratricopeptide repeat protein [Mariprofundus ferrooxydans]|uniref:tetratricopeptide repeat protein n=1 Tax=Mariprofundus ferrooxydans TaxID=314344 RepID=UPI001430A6E5|nr:tetratricopeptide repeat protein [Mariprofundus ferrooxydans]
MMLSEKLQVNHRHDGSRVKHLLFVLLMLASGFAGISYEVLYGRMLGNLIGDQFVVSAAILITFLLGIGIGSRYAWRLWRSLWLIEAMIGVYGAGFVFGASWLEGLLYATLPVLPAGLAGTVIACIALLLLPAFLIGCSVPLFAGYMSRISEKSEFSGVYGIYNIGAALTAILIEFVLLRWLGIHGAVLVFVGINLFIAAALRFGYPALRSDPPRVEVGSGDFYGWQALIPVSMASAVFQLFMVKLAEMILGPFRESFALVLSIVLLGIAVGSLLVRRFRISFQTVLLLALVGLLLLLAGLVPVTDLYASLYASAAGSYVALVLLKWLCLFVLMGIPCIAFGATIPALLGENSADVSKDSGYLLYLASMGNVAGFLLMVFLLHRYLDYGVQLLVIGACIACSMLLCRQRRLRHVVMSALLLLACGGAWASMWDEGLLYVSYTSFHAADDLRKARQNTVRVAAYKGYQDVFAINEVNGSPYFFINGYNSIPLNNPSEKVVGSLASIFSADTGQALVLGLGSGATASVVGQMFGHTDVVEINPVVRENLFRMKRWNFDIESNPAVNIVVDDAIHYVRAADKQYDLILNTVTTPLYFSSSKLYTRDFFQVVKQRLKGDGVYVTWLDARVGDRGVDIILNTVADSFRHCALLYIKSSYFLLLCSDQPISAHSLPGLQKGQPVYDNLLAVHGIPAEWLPYQLLTTDALALVADKTLPLNRADYPTLEFEMARLRQRGIPAFKSRLRRQMNLDDIRHVVSAQSPLFPGDLVWHTKTRLGDSSLTRRWRQLSVQAVPDFDVRYADAQGYYATALHDAHATPAALHEFGYLLMREGWYADAIAVFKYVLRQDPEHRYTAFNLGACYEYSGDLPAALRAYEEAGRVEPDDADVPYRIGRVYVKQGRFDDAQASLKHALALMGENGRPDIYRYLAKAYEGVGNSVAAADARRMAEGK